MIGFFTDDNLNGSFYHYINDSSDLVVPISENFDQSSEDYVFFQTMAICRNNGISVKHVELSGKHLAMFEKMVHNFPRFCFYRRDSVHFHGDLASFIIHNYANWLIKEVN